MILAEIWTALESEVEAAGGTLICGLPPWLRRTLHEQTIAITLGRRIYLGDELLTLGADEVAAIVAHEIEHVRQFERVGVARFVWRYGRDYVRNRLGGMSAYAAYEAISFEVEARIAENRFRRARETGDDVRIT